MADLTIRELAAKLKVSPSTISLVLNNKPGISDKTRKYILSEIKKAGYYRERRTSVKGYFNLVISTVLGQSTLDYPIFANLVKSIESQAYSYGYNINISYAVEQDKRQSVLRQGDGLLLLGSDMTEAEIGEFLQSPQPFVVLDNNCKGIPINSISTDNYGGIASAINYLMDCGHEKIGFLHSWLNVLNFKERLDSFVSIMCKYNLDAGNILEVNRDGTLDVAQLRSTAYIADNDNIAFIASRTFSEIGKKLGEDISIIGFNDTLYADLANPPLTSVKVHMDKVGELAVDRLVTLKKEPGLPHLVTRVGTTLIVRDSVKNLKA